MASNDRITRDDLIAAVNYIEQHAWEGLSVRRLVLETQRVPSPVFVRHFQAFTGKTPREAIRRRQLEEVRRLLERTELSPESIAELCGFSNLRSAAKAFQAAEGRVPRRLLDGLENDNPASLAATQSCPSPVARLG